MFQLESAERLAPERFYFVTLVDAVNVLFPVCGSGFAPTTVVVSLIVLFAAAVTCTTSFTRNPEMLVIAFTVGTLHITVLPLTVQGVPDARSAHPSSEQVTVPDVALTKVAPAGTVVVTATLSATLGPRFRTAIAYVRLLPVLTLGLTIVATRRSAEPKTTL